MPGFDGTGPMGQSPMTGGGRGYCAIALKGAGVRPIGRGGFYGRGRGRGYRNRFYATGLPGWVRAQKGMQAFGDFSTAMSKDEELSMLKDQAGYLKGELDAIEARIHDLENK
ncbi:MAG: DUF5320 domain-containing protein [Candidatus Omnitrophota bacterium]